MAKLQQDIEAQRKGHDDPPRPATCTQNVLKHAGLYQDQSPPPCQHRGLPNRSLRRGRGGSPWGEGLSSPPGTKQSTGREAATGRGEHPRGTGHPSPHAKGEQKAGAYLPASATRTCPGRLPRQIRGARGRLAGGAERIWPVDELLGVFPDYVLFPKEEERSVDREAVLPDGDGVVQSHSPGSLRFGLLEGSWGPSCRSRRSLPAPVLVRTPVSRAQPAGHCLPKASHPGRKHTGEPKQPHQGREGGGGRRRGRGGCRAQSQPQPPPPLRVMLSSVFPPSLRGSRDPRGEGEVTTRGTGSAPLARQGGQLAAAGTPPLSPKKK